MDRILRGGLQRPGRAVRLHPQLSRQESQEEPRSGTEGCEPEGRQDYYSGPLTFTTRYNVTYVRSYHRQHSGSHTLSHSLHSVLLNITIIAGCPARWPWYIQLPAATTEHSVEWASSV